MSIKSVKYLFKYVYKGHDCANVEAQPETAINHDEVSNFLNARSVYLLQDLIQALRKSILKFITLLADLLMIKWKRN